METPFFKISDPKIEAKFVMKQSHRLQVSYEEFLERAGYSDSEVIMLKSEIQREMLFQDLLVKGLLN